MPTTEPKLELVWSDERAEVHRVVVGPMDNNVYVVRDKDSERSVLIDAADEPDLLVGICRDMGVDRILTTHGHGDHIQAVPAVRQAGLEVFVHADDAERLPAHDGTVADGDAVTVGDVTLTAIHTPGHTAGSTCFRLEGAPVLFSGDTLFPGGPGATSFPGGDFETIIRSIEDRLFTMDDDVIVMPGHGADTTIGTERPHLQEWIDRGW
jgi:glyoxylase-like metal-dependent hydrolase (beta-lactamase superfamily II)